ncbi:glycosyltransferase family 4 protein [Candidatus Dependentiae bacterium]|nr:glycosyltransferase family 4 protein [Candidatus Dependentiae bacterium]
MSKLKVLFIKHDGVLRVNRRYLEIISEKRDWEVHLISPESWCAPSFKKRYLFEDSNDKIIKHPIPASFVRHPIFFKYKSSSIKRLSKEINPDVVFISNDPYAITSYQGIKYNKDKKIIIYGVQNIHKFIPFPFSSIYRHNLKYCNYFLGCNKETLKINQAWGFKGPIDYLPIGIDRNSFKRKNNNLLSSPPNIGFFGRIEEIKGIKYLVKALNKLNRSIKFIIVGEGSLKGWILKNLTNKKVQLEIKSFIPHVEIYKEYLKLDLLIVPSITIWRWKEQFGRVLVESMASGVPVIGTDSGAIPDVLGDAGLIVKERSAEAIANAIKILLNNEEKRLELIENGIKRVEKYFYWESVADKVISVIEKLI